jgi:hypothetical protein
MKAEYDFSKAEQGTFYRPIEELDIPIYLDEDIKSYFYQVFTESKKSFFTQ